ncbi:MAG TPA: GNAT family N-acetyltransferase [Dehalococcoidia bacterium]|nr:GNAT family N-acetyltransferase [Dehalococcoidia bacterium]
MLRECRPEDTAKIYQIINEAATAYEGAIPDDCYHQPYMPADELEREMARVIFYGWEEDGELVGVMGIEPIKNTTLIRHAYVLPQWQHRGIATRLLEHLKGLTKTPQLLVGTWADATWALDFYQRRGFRFLPDSARLLETYWDIPRRQIETSVVLGMDIGES